MCTYVELHNGMDMLVLRRSISPLFTPTKPSTITGFRIIYIHNSCINKVYLFVDGKTVIGQCVLKVVEVEQGQDLLHVYK